MAVYDAACSALLTCAALVVSHLACSSIVMHMDLSGKWAPYSLHKKRVATAKDYVDGWRSFCADQLLMFLPFMTFCFWYSADKINNCTDTLLVSVAKLGTGYLMGKMWATFVHYMLHFPSLYRFHRRHHHNPNRVVASAAWDDSLVEYALMELPSFGITVLIFPTHFLVYIVHFFLHGYDGAANHSGFSGVPGILGYLFDGEYHYHHHNLLSVNYAEIELIDKLFGTHHSYRLKNKLKVRQTALCSTPAA
jgi:sterol desaturase/sphingolipid hydroxylase (fatty acid hydroxylase superfamily)